MRVPMRVQHILAERGYSGGEVQLQHLVEHLHARGHEQAFVLPPGAAFGDVARAIGAEVTDAELRRSWLPGAAAALRGAVRRFTPDIVHFGCGRSLLWGGWLLRGEAVPVRVTTRRIDYPIRPGWFHGGRYRRLVDHTVANCESVRRAVLEAGVPEDRVSLVHEGIEMAPWDDLPERAAARDALGLPPDALVIGCAATLRPRKGQRQLLQAFAAVHADRPEARLVLAGSGPDQSRLRRLAARLGVADAVLVPGPIKPVAQLYAALDLFCMPSFHEGLSNACLEASAAGLPLVVSGVGGLPEIVLDGETGSVVPPGDVDALAAALRRWGDDVEGRVAAGAAGARRTRSLFTHARMAEGMEALFTRLLDGSRCTTP